MEKSAALIEEAKTDLLMSVRLAGVSDLIAAEDFYHLPCLITFERRCAKNKLLSGPEKYEYDESLMKLCRDLIAGLNRSHLYDMEDVWNRNKKLCEESGCTVPRRYQSQPTTFCKEIQRLVGWTKDKLLATTYEIITLTIYSLLKYHNFCCQKPRQSHVNKEGISQIVKQ